MKPHLDPPAEGTYTTITTRAANHYYSHAEFSVWLDNQGWVHVRHEPGREDELRAVSFSPAHVTRIDWGVE